MSLVRFSENILQSHYQFEQYLAGEEAIARIKAEAGQSYVPGACKLGALQVTWVTCTTPFRVYYSLFLEAMGALLYYGLAMRKEALYFYVEAKRQDHYTQMVLDNYFFSPFTQILVDTMNTFSFEAEEVFTHDPIDLSKMDESVVEHLHKAYIDDKRLIFDRLGGQCSGIGDWFAYLYHQTKGDFNNEEQHLVAVAKQFTDGAGKEAALLQLAQNEYPPTLGQRRFVERLESPTKDKVQDVFNRLMPGIYDVSTLSTEKSKSGHRLNFIQTSTQTYLLDPNWGLIKDTVENFSESLAKNHKVTISRL